MVGSGQVGDGSSRVWRGEGSEEGGMVESGRGCTVLTSPSVRMTSPFLYCCIRQHAASLERSVVPNNLNGKGGVDTALLTSPLERDFARHIS